MAWQDWVLSAGGFLVFVSLMPTVLGPEKPALSTSLMSAGLVAVIAVTLATLELWLGASANAAVAVAWTVIAAQTLALRRRRS